MFIQLLFGLFGGFGAQFLGFVYAHLLGSFGLGGDFSLACLLGGFLAGFELIYAAFYVDYALLAGEEGVGRAGDMDFYQRVFYAVNSYSLVGRNRRAGNDGRVIVAVLKDDRTIVIRVNTFFHNLIILADLPLWVNIC